MNLIKHQLKNNLNLVKSCINWLFYRKVEVEGSTTQAPAKPKRRTALKVGLEINQEYLLKARKELEERVKRENISYHCNYWPIFGNCNFISRYVLRKDHLGILSLLNENQELIKPLIVYVYNRGTIFLKKKAKNLSLAGSHTSKPLLKESEEAQEKAKLQAFIYIFLYHHLTDYNRVDEKGRTFLHYICQNKYVPKEIIKKVIERTNSIDLADKEGNTPLHYACQSGSAECIKLLIKESSAGINKKNEKNRTPLDELFYNGEKYSQTEKEQLLCDMVKAGAKINRIELNAPCLGIRTDHVETPILNYRQYLNENNLFCTDKQKAAGEHISKERFDEEVEKFLSYFPIISLDYILSGRAGEEIRSYFFSNTVIANYLARSAYKMKEGKSYPEYSHYEKILYLEDLKTNGGRIFNLRAGEYRTSKSNFAALDTPEKPKPYRYHMEGGIVKLESQKYYKHLTGEKIAYKKPQELGQMIGKINKNPEAVFQPFVLEVPGHLIAGFVKKEAGENKKVKEIVLFNGYDLSNYSEKKLQSAFKEINGELESGQKIKRFKDLYMHVQKEDPDVHCYYYAVNFLAALNKDLPEELKKEIIGTKFSKGMDVSSKNRHIMKKIKSHIKSKCPTIFKPRWDTETVMNNISYYIKSFLGKLFNIELEAPIKKFDKKTFSEKKQYIMDARWKMSQLAIIHYINKSRKRLRKK